MAGMKTVAVIFGGRSAEHDISIITAITPIMKALHAASGYKVLPIYIAKDGSWYMSKQFQKIQSFQRSDFNEFLKKLGKVRLLFDSGLKIIEPGIRQKTHAVDVVFPAMHGTYGEDGSLMGLLRMSGTPFVGCDMAASAVAMDKVFTKQVTEAAGLPSVPYVWFTASEWQHKRADAENKLKQLKLPVFVKPVHLGSSIAVSHAKSRTELLNAIEVALHYDDKVIVEKSVEDLIEVTVPVMGDEDSQRVALVERSLGGFFSFDEKYLKGGGKKKLGGGKTKGANSGYSELPAKLPKQLYAQIEEMTKQTFRAIGGSGIMRVDFLINAKTKKPYVNEINTLPGSLYHHNWKAAGVSAVELVTNLVEIAEKRYAKQKDLTFSFKSSFLQQF